MHLLQAVSLFSVVAVPAACLNIPRGASGSNSSSPSSTFSTAAYKPTVAPSLELSSDSQFSFYLSEVLSLSNGGGANTGEVLRIATGIIPHDFESTYTSFNNLATHIHALADGINATRDPVGAREAYFRAATYYRGADFFLIGNWEDGRNYALWDKQLETFDKAIALLDPVPGERFEVKAFSEEVGEFEAIGIFYKAAKDDAPRPTVVIGSGYDGSQEELYHQLGKGILARGLNVVTYEGPGQPTVRRQQDIGFIPDWWNVASPVVDWLSTRSDVDMSKLGLIGVSFGGDLAPIAASKEPRFSALLTIDGLPNMQQAIADEIPSWVKLYNTGNQTAFNNLLLSSAADTSAPTSERWLINQSLWAFKTHSPYDWWTRLGQITWNASTVANMTLPVFIAKGQDDTLTGNQADLAYQIMTTGRPNGRELTAFYEFKTDLGAGMHCSIGAEDQLQQVCLDWLAGVWGIEFENGSA